MNRSLPSSRFAASKREAAAWLGISVQALDAWLAKGAPTLERSAKGFKFDLYELVRWRYAPPPESGTRLDPAQERARLDRARADIVETQLAEKLRHLIPAAEYEAALSSALKTVAAGLESLPDLLERDAALPGPAIERTIEVIDQMRDALYRRLAGEEG